MGAAVEGDETAGYRVLDVVQGSPAARAGMVQCLDFVLVANGVRVVRRATSGDVCGSLADDVVVTRANGAMLTPSDGWRGIVVVRHVNRTVTTGAWRPSSLPARTSR